MMTDNDKRRLALQALTYYGGDSLDEKIIDLLTDLQHLAVSRELDFKFMKIIANSRYRAEKKRREKNS